MFSPFSMAAGCCAYSIPLDAMLSVVDSGLQEEQRIKAANFPRSSRCGPTGSFPKSGEKNPGRGAHDIRMKVIRYGLPCNNTARCNRGVADGMEEGIGS